MGCRMMASYKNSHSVFFGAYAKIYTLMDIDGGVFYVGCTTQPLQQRLNLHILQSKRIGKSDKDKKIKSLQYKVIIKEVDRMWVTAIKGQWALAKAKYLEGQWIIKYKEMGFDLTNKQINAMRADDEAEIIGKTKRKLYRKFYNYKLKDGHSS